MKLTKKMFALALTVAMAATAAGCGAKQETDVEALLQKANDTMVQVQSMSAQMEMQLDMAYDKESMNTVIKSDMDLITEPLKANMTISMAINDEVLQEYEMYLQQKEDNVDTYMQVAGEWYHQNSPMGDVSQYNAQQNMELYLKNISSFTAAGTEEINGMQTTLVEGVLTGDSMKEALKSSGIESASAGMGLSADDLLTLLDNMEDLPVKLWIGDDGYVYQYELDMTAMMQAVIKNLTASEEDAETVDISKTIVRMTCSNFDAVPDFEIPAEALAAA